MAAAGLLWCAVYDKEATPSKRLIMRLRKSIYVLIDRNLLFGETVSDTSSAFSFLQQRHSMYYH
jgi:hypothetical protein